VIERLKIAQRNCIIKINKQSLLCIACLVGCLIDWIIIAKKQLKTTTKAGRFAVSSSLFNPCSRKVAIIPFIFSSFDIPSIYVRWLFVGIVLGMSVKKKSQVTDLASSQQSSSKNSSTTAQDHKSPPLESINTGSKQLIQQQNQQQAQSKLLQ